MDRPLFPSRRADFIARLASEWPLKLVGVPTFMAVFFAGYFLILRYPLFEVTYMPVTALDYAVPYDPAALAIYISLWLYVSLVPSLLRTRQELFTHARAAGLVGLLGFSCFILWPTAIPEGAGLTSADAAALAWLKQVDAAGNACPSLHVAFASLAGVWLHRIFTEMRLPVVFKVLSITWVVAICYSTLATKQHVLIDVVAGAALGVVAGRVSTRVPGTSRIPKLQVE